ncbi:MAG: molybdopterin molybdotransferase MoeA [Tissierellia bacterium]|nr:molybdopterin molybdotransferase MoeA [Tissierellia bacterium]
MGKFDNVPSREEVLRRYFKIWTPMAETESIPVDEALGRVVASQKTTLYDLPVYRASAADGIAVKGDDFKDKMPDTSNFKLGVDFVRADTGDDFSDDYDTIIAIEDVVSMEDGLKLKDDVEVITGQKVKGKGSHVHKGEIYLTKGNRLRPTDLAALVMGGHKDVAVIKKPKVAYIPTGSELIPEGCTPKRGENLNSNSILVENFLIEMGAEPIIMPIVRDNKRDLKEALYKASSKADIVLISGGSSKGEEDFNTKLIEKEGSIFQHYVACVPGFPLGIGFFENKPIVNLAGPPIACYNGLDWCVRALIDRWYHRKSLSNLEVLAIADDDIRVQKECSLLVKLNLYYDEDNKLHAVPLSHHKDSLVSCLTTEGQIRTIMGGEQIKKGDTFKVELLVHPNEIPRK